MLSLRTIKTTFMLISTLIIFNGCTKKLTKINFKDIGLNSNKMNSLIITSMSSKEDSQFYEYNIRIPKLIIEEKEKGNLEELNTELNEYVSQIVTRLEIVSKELKPKNKKFNLKIDYEIYHGYNIYTIILIATQEINDSPITNYRNYYIQDKGNYIYNIDNIIKTDEAFPFFIKKIKEKILPNELLFDLQQAVIYFENKKIIIKFPEYTFKLDDTEELPNTFEFNESEIAQFVK
ncbi:hypothetical protein QIA17_01660 [Borreliella californiensis]|uniref:Uncharacterized protein n=1 Tax=Borreliella californiensis TaxID=373543 RepID=A0A7W9ZKD1_9SPIR|nr:hypothetical protein [Borreliella californiensis]MBB6213142.1 hypothetical protein [Borreliella californiensis]WKC91529.1 hypothetical protein QIA17_01660 [Borreliella californiensis]WNY70285.1 hypothetical protein QIA39_01125 [Borreliella californiensis]